MLGEDVGLVTTCCMLNPFQAAELRRAGKWRAIVGDDEALELTYLRFADVVDDYHSAGDWVEVVIADADLYKAWCKREGRKPNSFETLQVYGARHARHDGARVYVYDGQLSGILRSELLKYFVIDEIARYEATEAFDDLGEVLDQATEFLDLVADRLDGYGRIDCRLAIDFENASWARNELLSNLIGSVFGGTFVYTPTLHTSVLSDGRGTLRCQVVADRGSLRYFLALCLLVGGSVLLRELGPNRGDDSRLVVRGWDLGGDEPWITKGVFETMLLYLDFGGSTHHDVLVVED